MKRSSMETSVGIFMVVGIVCIGYLTVHLGKMDWFGGNYYPIYARFQSASGLRPGSSVEMAGVEIGRIESIALNQEKQVAEVKLMIRDKIVLTEDSIASIKTAGLIGDRYITISAGGSDRILKAGDRITETESAVNIEDLIGKYVFGSAK